MAFHYSAYLFIFVFVNLFYIHFSLQQTPIVGPGWGGRIVELMLLLHSLPRETRNRNRQRVRSRNQYNSSKSNK
jgi:hypothetical protein